LKSIIHQ
jgi:hypothetical protein